MKKLLSTILASTMILSAVSTSFAVELSQNATATPNTVQNTAQTMSTSSYTGYCGPYATYSFNPSTGTMTISGTGEIWDFEFHVNQRWYSYQNDIKSVVISKGITAIGQYAFGGCDSLSSVSIPNTVTKIGYSSFNLCPSLTSVTIPNSVTRIGERAFSKCTSLTSVTMPNSIVSIEQDIFEYCTSLTSVTLPLSVKIICYKAFRDCTSLTTVYYEGSVADRDRISIEWSNDDLENATWIYHATGDSTPTPTPDVTPTYAVTASNSTNGTINLGQTTAEEGDRVTFSVVPNSGYMIETVTVKDGSGNLILRGYDWVDQVYGFTMPSGNVTISATFSIIPTVTYTPEVEVEGEGSHTLSTTSPTASEVVTIYPEPRDGWVISRVTVYDEKGNSVLCSKVSEGVYQYIQPSTPVKIIVCYRYVTETVENYVDIDYEDWYAAYASYCIENGLMNSTSTGVFDPDLSTSRAMVALILANVTGETIPTATSKDFHDVPLGEWYSDAISWCKERGIVGGYDDGNFGVNDPITREQMVTILRGFAGYMGYDTELYYPERLFAYSDSTAVSPYAVEPFQWALGLNYIQGDGNLIKAKDSATRAEFANILNFFLENN